MGSKTCNLFFFYAWAVCCLTPIPYSKMRQMLTCVHCIRNPGIFDLECRYLWQNFPPIKSSRGVAGAVHPSSASRLCCAWQMAREKNRFMYQVTRFQQELARFFSNRNSYLSIWAFSCAFIKQSVWGKMIWTSWVVMCSQVIILAVLYFCYI